VTSPLDPVNLQLELVDEPHRAVGALIREAIAADLLADAEEAPSGSHSPTDS